MRLTLFIVAAAMGLAGFGPARAQTLPAVDWSGFYVGAGLGAVNGQSGFSMATDGRTSAISGTTYLTNANDHSDVHALGTGSANRWAPAGGIETGYSKQFGHVLVGIEASANSLFLEVDRTKRAPYTSLSNVTFTTHEQINADWQATVRPRLGWAEDNWLAYVTAGVAVTQVNFEVEFFDTNKAALPGTYGRASESAILPGWTAGFGGEYSLSPNWSLRGSYLYTEFSGTDARFRIFNPNFSTLYNFLNSDGNLRTHTFLVGLTYHFN